jgi:3-methylfumaryl-CoA hydratase
VPDTATGGGLADHLAHWAPPAVEMSRQVDPGSSAAFAALIDAAPPALGAGTPLPPVWHWFTLLDHPATSAIGADGHLTRVPQGVIATLGRLADCRYE